MADKDKDKEKRIKEVEEVEKEWKCFVAIDHYEGGEITTFDTPASLSDFLQEYEDCELERLTVFKAKENHFVELKLEKAVIFEE